MPPNLPDLAPSFSSYSNDHHSLDTLFPVAATREAQKVHNSTVATEPQVTPDSITVLPDSPGHNSSLRVDEPPPTASYVSVADYDIAEVRSSHRRNASIHSCFPLLNNFVEYADRYCVMPAIASLPSIHMLPHHMVSVDTPQLLSTIEGRTLPVLLDSGAELSVLPKALMCELVGPSNLAGQRIAQSFAGSPVLLEGPRILQVSICGIKIVHPFYAVDADVPSVVGYDLMTAARLVIDTHRRRVWSTFSHPPADPVQPSVSASSDDTLVKLPDLHRVVHSSNAVSKCPRALSSVSASADFMDPSADYRCSLAPPNCSIADMQHHTDASPILSPDTAVDQTPPCQSDTTIHAVTFTVPEHLLDLYETTVSDNNLSEAVCQGLQQVLSQNSDSFAQDQLDIGFCDLLKHDIDTGDAKPIKQSPRRPPFAARDAEDEILDEMLHTGVIEPSASSWASPVCMVKKKDGTFRFCVDYRRVNAVSKRDAFPIPDVQDALDSLRGARWFATIDLLSGYWQLGMTERAKERSAFCTRRGLFHFTRMPFGLAGAPSSFCRLMSGVLHDLLWQVCICYLDDIIIYARTQQELLDRLDIVLSRLHQYRLKAKPSKCVLFKTQIEFLGYLVSHRGAEPLPDKLACIRDWPTPHCLRDVRAFYGLASYYRRFVRNFAAIAEPLSSLTRKNNRFQWTEEAQQAFDSLKTALLEAGTLAFPFPDVPCILDTDASDVAIGSVLSQVIDGQERPIAFFSKVLNKSQRNYCPTRRELLAVVASLQHFRHYLLSAKVILRTDHHSLKWLNTFKRPEGILARWIETLAEFDYTIEHRPGRLHCNADGVSRSVCKQCWGRVAKVPWVDELERADELVEPLGIHALRLMPQLSDPQLAQMQRDDVTLAPVYAAITQSTPLSSDDLRAMPLDSRNILAQRPAVQLRADVLVRCKDSATQLIVPESLRKELFLQTHAGSLSAHLGHDRTFTQLSQHYYWPGMRRDLRAWILACEQCAKARGPPTRPHGRLQKVIAGAPMDLVAIDILSGLPVATDGSKHILVVTDYFTKWVEAYSLPDQEASTCMTILYQNFFSRFGLPRQLHSDQGRNFESHLFADLCKITGIRRTRTTPFHPRSDGQTERMNRTLLQMLRTCASDSPKEWPSRLPAILAAYRMTQHKTTGVTPNMAMLGREVLLPCTLIAAPPEESDTVTTQFAAAFRDNMREAHHRVRVATQYSAKTQRTYFDQHIKPIKFALHQLVWLYWPRPLIRQKKRKLQQLWTGPWRITAFKSELVVVVQHVRNHKKQTVHVDRLAHCSSAVVSTESSLSPVQPITASHQLVSSSQSVEHHHSQQPQPHAAGTHLNPTRPQRTRRLPARYSQ